jgi:ABC-type Fe3+/spermidine/putrescine transport system ATPase subunit
MVFQNYAIFPHLNVRDNIAYGLRRLGTPPGRTGPDGRRDAGDDRPAGFGDRRANQLSGGQMQRVALARALILKPKVLLLDEPLGALDKQLREQMQLELRSLQRQLGITFVLVTHDQEEALTLSDRVAVMANGPVIQVDTPAGFMTAANSRKVAAFVGTMNFFDARSSTKAPTAGRDCGAWAAAREWPCPFAPRRRAVLVASGPRGFPSAQRPGSGYSGCRAAGQARQYLGGRQVLQVAIDGRAAPVAVAPFAARGDDPWDGREDEPVWLQLRPDALTVLDPD